MNCKYKSFGHDAAVMKRQIIMMAGEWLERANLRRGRANGDEVEWLEGAPLSAQPKAAKSAIELDKAVKAAQSIITNESVGSAIRETPRPQAMRH